MRILLLAVSIIVLTVISAYSETITITKEYTYQASDDDSKSTSRNKALTIVKRLLLEELGTYIESETTVINSELDKDQISSITAGVVKTEIIEEKWDGRIYFLKAKLAADPVEVSQSIKKFMANKRSGKSKLDTHLINNRDTEYIETKSPFACSKLTVKDKKTGLIWVRNGRLKTAPINWFDNQRLIDQLNKASYGGYSDWRMPTYDELGRIVGYAVYFGYGAFGQNGKGKYISDYLNANCFENVTNSTYITSTKDEIDEEGVMGIILDKGRVLKSYTIANAYLLPVRDGK